MTALAIFLLTSFVVGLGFALVKLGERILVLEYIINERLGPWCPPGSRDVGVSARNGAQGEPATRTPSPFNEHRAEAPNLPK